MAGKELTGMHNRIEKIVILSSFLFVFGYLIIFLIIPFFLYNGLNSWDLAGLYFSSWYQKEYLLPSVVGWNPYFFLGYPQNQFYPPLFSYVSALLGVILPLETAFKSLFSATLILMPVSFYVLNRSFGFSKVKSAACMALMFSMLFLFPEELFGGNMHATFRIGLVSHALGIALFFFYWAALNRHFREERYILASLLFAVIILTHIVAAFAASFIFMCYLLLYGRGRKKIIYFVKHGALAFLISAFWVVPFVGKIKWMEAYKVGVASQLVIFVFIAATYFAYIMFSKKKEYLPVFIFMITVLVFSFLSMGVESIPIHLYRFTMYLYLLIPFILFSLFNEDKNAIFVLILIVGIVLVVTSAPVNPEGPEYLKSEKINAEKTERVFVFAPYSKESSPHHLQHSIPMESGVIALKGLYTESAKNARYVFDIENQIEPEDTVTWGTYVDWELMNPELIDEILPYQLDALGVTKTVSTVYFDGWEKEKMVTSYYRKYPHSEINYTYYLFKLNNSGLIRALNYTPEVFEGSEEEWRQKTAEWFLGRGIKEGVIVHNDEVPKSKGYGNETIEILEMSKRQDYLKFHVNSAGEIPVLIKISGADNWRAYQIEGNSRREIKIYRASPYIMLVYGKGDIELNYEKVAVDYLGIILSLIGITWIFTLFLHKSGKFSERGAIIKNIS